MLRYATMILKRRSEGTRNKGTGRDVLTMDIRLKTCLIIRKNKRYLVGLDIWNQFKWSNNKYDAWRTRNRKTARIVARECGGVLMLFNPVAGQIKEF